MTIDHATRARALVGTRFRLQGRGADGLDCVGVVVATFGLPDESVRRDYGLRGDHRDEAEACLQRHFRRVPLRQSRAGDVLLLQPSLDQLHLAVRTDAGFVHAHAGIRRVVETPGLPEWPLLAVYRKRKDR
jgi:hypothetical protein